MPRFRIYYVARRPHGIQIDSEYTRSLEEPRGLLRHGEMDWEEDVEAKNAREALRAFFEEHLESLSDLAYIDEDGRTQRPRRIDDFDPNRTYVWTEDDKLMEFQGIETLEGAYLGEGDDELRLLEIEQRAVGVKGDGLDVGHR